MERGRPFSAQGDLAYRLLWKPRSSVHSNNNTCEVEAHDGTGPLVHESRANLYTLTF